MREGENWVYDIFLILVRFWWFVIKSVAFIVMYVLRHRPTHLAGPKTLVPPLPPVQQTETQQSNPVPSSRSSYVVLLVFGIGLVAFSAYFWLTTRFMNASDTFVIALLGIGGLALIGYAVWSMRQKDVGNFVLSNATQTTTLDVKNPDEEEITVVYAIRLPNKTTWNSETALHFVSHLLHSFPKLLLSIVADPLEISWQVIDTEYALEPHVLKQLIRSSYPEAEIDVALYEPETVENPFYRYITYYQQPNMFVAPMLYVDAFKSFDPLSALTQAMSALQEGERVRYLLAFAGTAEDAYKHGERLITQSTIHPMQFLYRHGVANAANKIISGYDRVDKYEARDQRVLEDKLRAKLFYAYLFVQVDALETHRVGQLAALVDTQMEHFTRMPYNTVSWVERPLETHTIRIDSTEKAERNDAITLYRQIMQGEFKKTTSAPPFLVLEPKEIAALWHLPHAEFSAPRISWASGIIDMPDAVAKLKAGVVIGLGKSQGQGIDIRIPPSARRAHLNVIGRTGTGKSTLLHNLIHQDIAQGEGVAVIDPHGKLVQDILHSSIPPGREDDVVLLDIANKDYPPPLNPMGSMGGYTGTLRIVGIIERLFSGTEESARMASYLRAALIPLQHYPHATARDVTRMFMDDSFREARLNAIDDPETLDFWDYQFNHASSAQQRQIAEPILNRLRPFFANQQLYPILCHPDALNFRELIRQKKIILISLALDAERIPEQERDLVGALLMSRLQMAGMQDGAEKPYVIYVDEVQRFVTTSLSEMLSESRKYGISLVLANQYLSQLAGKTLEAVLGNVGATVIFQCSPEDSRDLAAYTKPQFDAQDLLELHRYQAILKMQVDGQTQRAFNFFTLPPPDIPADATERVARIRRRSIEQYTPKTYDEVLAWLKERYPRRPTPNNKQTNDEATFYE